MKKEWYFIFVLAGVSLLLGSFQNSNVNYGPLSCDPVPPPKDITVRKEKIVSLSLQELIQHEILGTLGLPSGFSSLSVYFNSPNSVNDRDKFEKHCLENIPYDIFSINSNKELMTECFNYCGPSCSNKIINIKNKDDNGLEINAVNNLWNCEYVISKFATCVCENFPSGVSPGGRPSTDLNNLIEEYINSWS